MAAIIKNNYRTFNVESLLRSMEGSSPSNILYTFIATAKTWSDVIGGSDSVPPQPLDNIAHETAIWKNLLAVKRVLRSDISAGIKKRMWTYGSYYDIYRHDYGETGVTGINEVGAITIPKSLSETNYYVVTESGNVYICIDNNKGANPSTDNPENYNTGVDYGVFTTSDNYKWKFIATVSPADYAKFASLEFFPVQTLTTAPLAGSAYEKQYLSQETAKNNGGAIYNILVANGGTSSFISTTITSGITIKGDGQGLTISAVTNSSGAVTAIKVLTPGTGYSYCNITIDGVSGLVLTPIFTPLRGLGSDPIKDLSANYLLINAKFSYDEDGDFTVFNDFRQIGLIVNPKTQAGSPATEITLDATYVLTLNTSASFTPDAEFVCSNGTRGTIVDWNSVSKKMRVVINKPSNPDNWSPFNGFSVGQTISQVGGSGGQLNAPITEIKLPEIKHYSGDIIYFENRRPIQRDINQIEDFKIVIEY